MLWLIVHAFVLRSCLHVNIHVHNVFFPLSQVMMVSFTSWYLQEVVGDFALLSSLMFDLLLCHAFLTDGICWRVPRKD